MSSRLLTSTLRQSLAKRVAQTARNPQLFRQVAAITPVLRSSLIRGYSTNTPASQLTETLKSELKISNTVPNDLDPVYSDYLKSSGFEVIESDGQSNVQLKKTLPDGQVVRVFFDIDEVTDVPINEDGFPEGEEGQELEDLEQEMESLDSLLCSVKVLFEKPTENTGLFLNLFLQGSDSSFLVDFVNHQNDVASFLKNEVANGEFVNKFRYQGPRFSDLDESVQTGFETYLDSQGIDSQLAEFILTFSEFKEEKEYRKWLSDLANYLK